MSLIIDGLYVGSFAEASNKEWLQENNISHILNLAKELPEYFPSEFAYKKIPLEDLPTCKMNRHFSEIFRFIDEGRKLGTVLVHCMMGISRSASAVLYYLMEKEGMSFTKARRFLKEKRTFVRPNQGFITQLVNHEMLKYKGTRKQGHVSVVKITEKLLAKTLTLSSRKKPSLTDRQNIGVKMEPYSNPQLGKKSNATHTTSSCGDLLDEAIEQTKTNKKSVESAAMKSTSSIICANSSELKRPAVQTSEFNLYSKIPSRIIEMTKNSPVSNLKSMQIDKYYPCKNNIAGKSKQEGSSGPLFGKEITRKREEGSTARNNSSNMIYYFQDCSHRMNSEENENPFTERHRPTSIDNGTVGTNLLVNNVENQRTQPKTEPDMPLVKTYLTKLERNEVFNSRNTIEPVPKLRFRPQSSVDKFLKEFEYHIPAFNIIRGKQHRDPHEKAIKPQSPSKLLEPESKNFSPSIASKAMGEKSCANKSSKDSFSQINHHPCKTNPTPSENGTKRLAELNKKRLDNSIFHKFSAHDKLNVNAKYHHSVSLQKKTSK
jgi:protein-tyrosine phosphatase